jgi:macrolide transport system ATP-binding/permease protein
MTGFWQDLRYSLRTLKNSPGFVIAGVLALAFGIGINAMVFTLLNAAILRPLPVKDAGELVTIYQNMQGVRGRFVNGTINYLSYAEYAAYRDRNKTLQGIAAYASSGVTLGGEGARSLGGQLATCNYFTVLTEGMALGRGFLEEECKTRGSSPVVVVSHKLWQRQFDGDRAVVGRRIIINGTSFTIVGVAPEGFSGASLVGAEIWAPIAMESQWTPGRALLDDANVSWLQPVARLKPDVSLSAVRADLAVIASQIDQQNPGRTTTLSIDRATLMNIPRGRRNALAVGSVVLIAVSLVLLIACANLANLLMARASARQKEVAVRLAVGASRFRLVRQLLTESLLVSLAGGGLGVLTAWGTLAAAYPLLIPFLPEDAQALTLTLTPDIRVLSYSLLLCLATAMGFGLLPALQSSKVDLNHALKGGADGFLSSRSWFRSSLVATQVALCLVLLIGAGLLSRGLYAAQTIDPGMQMKDVAVASLDLTRQGYDEPRAREFHRAIRDRLRAQLGTANIVLADPVPLSGSRHQNVVTPSGQTTPILSMYATVSPGYFQVLQIPIVQGRPFDETDVREGAGSAIVSESTARRFWPDQNAVGQTLTLDTGPLTVTVVGVAKDVRTTSLSEVDDVFVYYPGNPNFYQRAKILAHGTNGFGPVAQAIQEEVRAMNPGILVRVTRLEDNPAQFQLAPKVTATLGLVLGIAGLLLASLGIYGVASFAVSRRTKEIGIRMSLGADAGNVLRMILWQSMRPVVIGMVFGAVASAAVSSVLSSLLFGVSPVDPVVYAGISLFLAAVAFFASRAPAQRAMRINPMAALRSE